MSQRKRRRNKNLNAAPPISLIDSDDELKEIHDEKRIKYMYQNLIENSVKVKTTSMSPILLSESDDDTPLTKYASDKNEIADIVEKNKESINNVAVDFDETADLLAKANSLLAKFVGKTNIEPIDASLDKAVDSHTVDEVDKTEENSAKLGICPVCLEPLGKSQLASTHCGHVFCMPCIQQVTKTVKKCPTCRKPITKKKYFPIFI